MIVDVDTAKTNLSRLIEQARAGEEVIITQGSEPLVKIVPIERTTRQRVFGSMRGKLSLGPEFFEPLPEDELTVWDQ
jgi:prevent-host-death family protein